MNRENCFVNEEEIYLFIDKELPEDRAAAMVRHIPTCWNCRTRCQILENLGYLLKDSIGATVAPVYLRERIVRGITTMAVKERLGITDRVRNLFRFRPYIPVSFAGILVGVFLIAMFLRPAPIQTMPLVTAMIEEHNEYIEDFHSDRGIISDDPVEVSGWIRANTGLSYDVPSGGAMPCLYGACSLTDDDNEITCLFFDQGEKRISLFMIKGDHQKLTAQKTLKFNNHALHYGMCTGNNYVAWDENGILCVLVGKQSHESLIRMAQSLI